jgi:Fe-Mn family superoxide dismutase
MTLKLSNLPYSYNALSLNIISDETLEYHHDDYQKFYFDKLLKDTTWEN